MIKTTEYATSFYSVKPPPKITHLLDLRTVESQICKNLQYIWKAAEPDVPPHFLAYNVGGDKFLGTARLEQWMFDGPNSDEVVEIRCTLEKHRDSTEISMQVIDKALSPKEYRRLDKLYKRLLELELTWKKCFIILANEKLYDLFILALQNLKTRYVDGNKKMKYSRHDYQKFTDLYCIDRIKVKRHSPVSTYIESCIKDGNEYGFEQFWNNIMKIYDVHTLDTKRAIVECYATKEGLQRLYHEGAYQVFDKKKKDVIYRQPSGNDAF